MCKLFYNAHTNADDCALNNGRVGVHVYLSYIVTSSVSLLTYEIERERESKRERERGKEQQQEHDTRGKNP